MVPKYKHLHFVKWISPLKPWLLLEINFAYVEEISLVFFLYIYPVHGLTVYPARNRIVRDRSTFYLKKFLTLEHYFLCVWIRFRSKAIQVICSLCQPCCEEIRISSQSCPFGGSCFKWERCEETWNGAAEGSRAHCYTGGTYRQERKEMENKTKKNALTRKCLLCKLVFFSI